MTKVSETATVLSIGDKVAIHEKYDFDTNCVVCGKSVGKNARVILVGDLNELITAEEYAHRASIGDFYSTLQIGSSCAKKFDKNVLSA